MENLLNSVENYVILFYIVFYVITVALIVWTIYSAVLRLINSVVRHIITKRKNDKTFKELGLNPKK